MKLKAFVNNSVGENAEWRLHEAMADGVLRASRDDGFTFSNRICHEERHGNGDELSRIPRFLTRPYAQMFALSHTPRSINNKNQIKFHFPAQAFELLRHLIPMRRSLREPLINGKTAMTELPDGAHDLLSSRCIA
jgi:hypothetical protein